MPDTSRKRQRSRVSFEVDEDVMPVIEPIPPGQKREYLNEAVRRVANPPYQLHIPERRTTIPITPLIEDMDQIILVGMTLKTISPRYGESLKDMARKQRRMTFLIMNPDVAEDSALFQMMRRVLGSGAFVETLQEQGRTSLTFFKELRTIGRRHGTHVNIFVYEEMPMCGLVITDPYTDRARMRVNIYSTMEVNAIHPVWDINPTTEEGRAAYGVYYRYYEQLLGRCEEV